MSGFVDPDEANAFDTTGCDKTHIRQHPRNHDPVPYFASSSGRMLAALVDPKYPLHTTVDHIVFGSLLLSL
jgi:hypothetical protein